VLTGLVTLFLLFDSVGKLLRLRQMVEGTAALGYPDSAVRVIGAILLACLILYLIPRTAVLGGILLTGYLGGAVASNLRVGNPLVTNTLFPIYVGALIWGSLLLREDRLRALVPLRQ
jgi:hypothetical protein